MRPLTTTVLLVTCTAILFGGLAAAGPRAEREKVRIGVYDNRAIAIAWAASEHNPVGEKMKEHEAAEAAGDKKRAKELEAWGERRQRQLHRQGFGRVPVDDLLEPVKDRLPEVARKAGLDAITWDCTFAGPNVEVVDVTMELVALYDPSPRTLEWAKQIGDHEPVDLDELAQNHDH